MKYSQVYGILYVNRNEYTILYCNVAGGLIYELWK